MRNRALMLRRLRTILRSRRPCLEACLRFLLFRNEDQQERQTVHMGFESSSDEDESAMSRRGRDTGVTVLQNDKNIAEPRTSQGVFGPNGMFFSDTLKSPHLYQTCCRPADLFYSCSCQNRP